MPRVGLFVGTSGWSYPKGEGAWDGIFYPPKLADKDKLTFYAQYFNTVEINSAQGSSSIHERPSTGSVGPRAGARETAHECAVDLPSLPSPAVTADGQIYKPLQHLEPT